MPHAYLIRALPEIVPVPTSQLPPLEVGLNRFSALTDAQAVCLRKLSQSPELQRGKNALVARALGKSRFRLVSYPNRIGDIKYIAELEFSIHKSHYRTTKVAKFVVYPIFSRACARSGFPRSVSHSLGLTLRLAHRSLTRSLPPTLAHWFPYTPLSRAVRMVGVGGGNENCLSHLVKGPSVHVNSVSASEL